MTENISYIILSGGIILCRFHWMMQEREDTNLIASFLARQPTERCAGNIELLFYTMNYITYIQIPLWNTLGGAARSPPDYPVIRHPLVGLGRDWCKSKVAGGERGDWWEWKQLIIPTFLLTPYSVSLFYFPLSSRTHHQLECLLAHNK